LRTRWAFSLAEAANAPPYDLCEIPMPSPLEYKVGI